ncbi:hypothetical protein [Natrinema soli]|uniref:Uncharacterized protein n=1 Tax=Natrinema soli TaxID=1930624 RepID=A0ABD5SS03_9EURY|nr:hypothetical protein [Natrinema soli]
MTVRDNWPDKRASVAIHVEYGDDPAPIEFEADGSDGPMVKFHVDMNHSK